MYFGQSNIQHVSPASARVFLLQRCLDLPIENALRRVKIVACHRWRRQDLIWCEGDTKQREYFYWIGNHMESNIRVCAALK